MSAIYDRIGQTYRRVRAPDPRIAALIEEALGDAVTVVNVGAGAGSYESPARKVVAVEPSLTMIRQRPRSAAPAVVSRAEALPFDDASVDACTAFLTVHHWGDAPKGLAEMRRVARSRVVLFTYVHGAVPESARWLTAVYFPFIEEADRRIFPRRELFEDALGPCRFLPVPIPRDCVDGFLDAYWSRPESYLEAEVRAGISGFQLGPEDAIRDGVERLARDLKDGSWDARFGALRKQETFDAGLRIVVAEK